LTSIYPENRLQHAKVGGGKRIGPGDQDKRQRTYYPIKSIYAVRIFCAGVAWKNCPPKKLPGVIFSQTVIVKRSPLGDLFTFAVCEKIPPQLFDH